MKHAFFFLLLIQFAFSCRSTKDSIELYDPSGITENSLRWKWIKSNMTENSKSRLVHQLFFSDKNQIRFHQSMSIYDNKAFCFNHGDICYVFDIKSKEELPASPLPEISHHNNAQFLDVFYQDDDKFPLLLLSRGDYPPNQNEFYIVRVEEKEKLFSFVRLKTIKNTLVEAKNGGSWFADTQRGTLYLYTMTKGDYRVREDNYSCVYTFKLPDLKSPSTVTLSYEDVEQYWEFPYFVYQGGTFYNGYLFFNVQSLSALEGKTLESSNNVLMIDSRTGSIEAVLPLIESLETEGIAVYNHNLYISYKNGADTQEESSTVFKLCEYHLPASIIKEN